MGDATGKTPEHPRTMRYWLGRTLRESRESNSIALFDMASAIRANGVKATESSLSRLETDKNGWPRGDLDAIVACYAHLCGIPDGRQLWQTIVDNWVQRGGAPAIGTLTPFQRAERLALEARQRYPQDGAGSQAAPISKGRRRKAG